MKKVISTLFSIMIICGVLFWCNHVDTNNTRVHWKDSETGKTEMSVWMPYEIGKKKEDDYMKDARENNKKTSCRIEHRVSLLKHVYSAVRSKPLPWEEEVL